MAKGIRQLDSNLTFAELFGEKTERVDIARVLAVDEETGEVVASFNRREIRGGKEQDRPAAWGMPGGTGKKEETPAEIILKHEYGEIPVKIHASTLTYLFSAPPWDYGDRTEQLHFFYVAVDRKTRTGFTDDEAKEISHAEFFSIGKIILAPRVGQKQPPSPDADPDLGEFYRSHKIFYIRCWTKYKEMKANGEIPPVPATASGETSQQ